MTAHDARVLLVPAVVCAHAGVRALQQSALGACAAHVVQQDGQRTALAKLSALHCAHDLGKAQLATHDSSSLGVPPVVAHGAPAPACEHLYAAAARAQPDGPHQAHGAVRGHRARRAQPSAPTPAALPASWPPGGPQVGPGRPPGWPRGGHRCRGRGAAAARRLSGLARLGARGALRGPDELCAEEVRVGKGTPAAPQGSSSHPCAPQP